MNKSAWDKDIERIEQYTQRHPGSMDAWGDLVEIGIAAGDHAVNRRTRERIEWMLPEIVSAEALVRMGGLHKKTLLFDARDDLDSFIRYIEYERDPSKQFYMPRRKALKPVVQALQMLEDDKADLCTVSLPPGVGKSTVALFFICHLAGKNPMKPILIGSHNNSFLRGMYDEIIRVCSPDGEYLWNDVFPTSPLVDTNAKDMMIDFAEEKRFATVELASVGSGLAGRVRCEQLLYCDDLVEGIEQALSAERMDKLFQSYVVDYRQRKLGGAKELHIATRWSVKDVIGRLQMQYEGDPRAVFISVPALNEKDESNFDYGTTAGFTTEFFHEQREIMDDASFKALYMNEPIEREGLLYQEDELRRYFDLPEETPDAVIAVCDTKDKGEDYCCLPVIYVYGNDYYLADVLCDNGKPEVVDPRMVDILIRNKVQMCRYESNSAGGRVAEKVQDMVKQQGGITHITTKYTTANKETKIIVNSAWVKEHILFKDKTCIKPGTDYKRYMDLLCSYTLMGKNKHDDAPDSIAMMAEYAQSFLGARVEVFHRPF